MDYNTPLIEGHFIKRYKRFFADVKIGHDVVVAHVPNTGSLKGICDQVRPCRVQSNDKPTRKLKFTLEQVQTETSWVGVNTHLANDLAWEAFVLKSVPHWLAYTDGSREVKINSETRLDLKLTNGDRPHFIEVKSVTLSDQSSNPALALFPDAVTIRGQKHLTELMKLQNAGASTELLFVVQRTDCLAVSPADKIDPQYGRLLREAHQSGVKITAYPATLTSDRLMLDTTEELRIILDEN